MRFYHYLAFIVLVIALYPASLQHFLTSAPELEPSLKGHIAIVTGASRGIGKGIAIGLGEQGATVYITGRGGDSTGRGLNGKKGAGSLEATCDDVRAAGGVCMAVPCDSGDDAAVEALFKRVEKEQGRLDILVNNAFSAVSWLPGTMGKPFWEKGTEAWDKVNHVGLRSHYIASVHAARLMSKNTPRKAGADANPTKGKRGIIINVSSFGGMNYIFDVAYGIGKAAMDRMANDMAIELYTENVAMVSLWPGLVATENVQDGAISGAKSRRGLRPGTPEMNINELLPTPLAETPLFSGRAVASLARDRNVMDKTGRVLPTSSLASYYGFVDERGFRTPPFTSLKFIGGIVLGKLGLLELDINELSKPGSVSRRWYWRRMPNLEFPAWTSKLDVGAPNL